MNVLPKPILNVIEELGKLPGVGPRTAERYSFQLLRADPTLANNIAEVLTELHESIDFCPKTFMLIEKGEEVSGLYENPARDKKIIAVVEDPLDVVALEKTGMFRGTYHVLGGALSPIDGVGPEQLHLKELEDRINDDEVEELIIATNASVEGESTALYVQKQFEDLELKITRLARGLPAGTDLEYADQITITRALEGRQLI